MRTSSTQVDMMMPGMTGMELAERLRLECYRGGTVPTVAVTGSDDATGWSEDYNTVSDIFDGAILKPLTSSLAIGLVTQWVLPSVMSIDLTNPVTNLRHELGPDAFRALPSGSVSFAPLPCHLAPTLPRRNTTLSFPTPRFSGRRGS